MLLAFLAPKQNTVCCMGVKRERVPNKYLFLGILEELGPASHNITLQRPLETLPGLWTMFTLTDPLLLCGGVDIEAARRGTDAANNEKSINQTLVPFAYDENNTPSCCLYEDPMKYANHTAKFLLLDLKFAQNVRFIEPYLAEISELLTFQDDIRYKEPIIRIAREIAKRTGLNRYLIYGDDQDFMQKIADKLKHDEKGVQRFVAETSTFSEGIDLYIASQVCGAFFMSAATSTFGWWLAFFTPNQNAVYYMDDKRAMWEKVPNKELFL
ncbi:hypothetical protein OESDEN_03259 [Oesophagostomum dentatum]|uniref:L-Fucosyltransferase n=1 Tax=Oesophagostomum dentatum TaxID=61180 RepID=A0A0B1THP6_OESDE|nr:hypothetical protein OESDEN_03259 [Oesophagostomum dentatum]